MIGIGQMYRQSRKINPFGIEGYQIEKKYESIKHILVEKKDVDNKGEKKKQSKRGHYLQDEAKIYGHLPGPAQYNYSTNLWTKTSENKKIITSKKLTFIQEIIDKEKKEKSPAPGQYNLFKTDRQINDQKRKLSYKKVSFSDRYTYLDAVQYEASEIPGVGSYNTIIHRPKSASNLMRNKKLGDPRSTKALKKRQKCPQVGTYTPKYSMQSKSFSKKKKGYHEWGRVQRFSQQKECNLGPGVYAVKDDSNIAKRGKTSVYYN